MCTEGTKPPHPVHKRVVRRRCGGDGRYTHIRYFWRINGHFTDGNHTCPCQYCTDGSCAVTSYRGSAPLQRSLPFVLNGGGGFMGPMAVTDTWWPRIDGHSAFAQTRTFGAGVEASFGRLNMTGYGGSSKDLSWQRRVVLSADTGVLVVADNLVPDSFQVGPHAYPVRHESGGMDTF